MEDTLEEYITEGLSNAKISRLVHTWGAWDVKGKRRTLKLLEEDLALSDVEPYLRTQRDLLYAPNLGHLKAIYEIQRGSKEYSERIYKVNINNQHTFYPLCFDLTERIIALLP